MDDFSINEMLEMQRALQEQYKDKWKPINPGRVFIYTGGGTKACGGELLMKKE